MDLTTANQVFGRELHLPYDLLFRASSDKKQSTTDQAPNAADQLYNIHNYNK
jgi:hypothetical protein